MKDRVVMDLPFTALPLRGFQTGSVIGQGVFPFASTSNVPRAPHRDSTLVVVEVKEDEYTYYEHGLTSSVSRTAIDDFVRVMEPNGHIQDWRPGAEFERIFDDES